MHLWDHPILTPYYPIVQLILISSDAVRLSKLIFKDFDISDFWQMFKIPFRPGQIETKFKNVITEALFFVTESCPWNIKFWRD